MTTNLTQIPHMYRSRIFIRPECKERGKSFTNSSKSQSYKMVMTIKFAEAFHAFQGFRRTVHDSTCLKQPQHHGGRWHCPHCFRPAIQSIQREKVAMRTGTNLKIYQ